MDDRLARAVRREAASRGLSVSAFIARTLDNALKTKPRVETPPFRLVTFEGQGLEPGVDLTCPRKLEALEDEERYG